MRAAPDDPPRYALDPALPVLLRPDGCVQVGWHPRRAVQMRPPDGLSAAGLATVLRALPLDAGRLHRLARRHGLRDGDGFDALLAGLRTAGVLRSPAAGGRTLSIRVHGAGPLAAELIEGLRCSGARVSASSHAGAAGAPAGVDLLLLTDYLGTDPRLLRDLHTARLPHLPVRVRDGVGVVGPLVVPGVTSCLSCVDLHRTDRDPAWPALAAQLRDVIGTADRPAVLATAAFALAQVQHIIAGVRGAADRPSDRPPPAALDTSWEVDVAARVIAARRWARHPLCGCWPRQE